MNELRRDARGTLYTEYLVLASVLGLVLLRLVAQLGQDAPDAFTRLCLRMLGVP